VTEPPGRKLKKPKKPYTSSGTPQGRDDGYSLWFRIQGSGFRAKGKGLGSLGPRVQG